MASNSKREQILEAIVAELGGISSIVTVMRTLQSYKDLRNFAITQFPAVAVIGRLPQPKEHIAGRRVGGVDTVVSELTVDLYAYFQNAKTPDTQISSLLDDLWAGLYADQTKGGLVISTILTPEELTEFWEPYGAFKLSVVMRYHHTEGGI